MRIFADGHIILKPEALADSQYVNSHVRVSGERLVGGDVGAGGSAPAPDVSR